MELNTHEKTALIDCIEKYIPILESQIRELAKIKHASSLEKKEMKREIEKKIQLLKDSLAKLKE